MRALTLFLPGLMPLDGPDLRDHARALPGLARLLGRARAQTRELPLEQLLLQTLGCSSELAWAPLTARIDLPAALHSDDWLRCDPVYMHADPNKVLMYPAPALSADDADAMLADLRVAFPELDLQRGAHPGRWYLRRNADLPGIAPSVQWLQGRSLSPHLPQAREHRAWRQYLNALQMALHAHPVNASREARGLPPVNGVWICGGGATTYSRSVTRTEPQVKCFGNDALLAGIAALRGLAWHATLPLDGEASSAAVLVAGRGLAPITHERDIDLAEFDRTRFITQMPARAFAVHAGAHSWHLSRFARLRFWSAPAHFTLQAEPST